jgi:G:T-mismatch repair DNA endonuclease (very short patch repair protein)
VRQNLEEILNGEFTLKEISKQRVLLRHLVCGQEEELSRVAILKRIGRGSPLCFSCSGRRITTLSISRALTPGYKLVRGSCKGSEGKVVIIHEDCGHEFLASYNGFVNRGNRCPFCSRRKPVLTVQDIQKALGEEYEVAGNQEKVMGSIGKVEVRHLKCGKKFETTYSAAANRGNRCPHCARKDASLLRSRKAVASFEEAASSAGCRSLGGYSRWNIACEVECLECGFKFSVNPGWLAKNPGRKVCPICTGRSIIHKDLGTLRAQVEKSGGGEYELLSDKYINTHQKYSFRHLSCGMEFEMTATNFLTSGNRCPKCSRLKSSVEESMQSFLEDLGVRVVANDREILGGLELDCYIPDKNIAIEINGAYWHGELVSRGKCSRSYHLKKTEEAARKGVRVLHFTDVEWNEKRSVVEGVIAHAVGVKDFFQLVNARECLICEINKEEARKFLKENHLQGDGRSSVLNIGLRDRLGVLVCLASFAVGAANRGGKDLELSRFSSATRLLVRGGLSRLMNALLTGYDLSDFNKVITYIDLRWATGSSFEKSGWKKEKRCPPSYSYVKNGKVFHKSTFKKKNLAVRFPSLYSPEKTEWKMMREAGYDRIWDCGKERLSISLREGI